MTDVQKYELFATLSEMPRTGWVQRGVTDAESITEHIYGCWLLGMTLLPEDGEEETYNKQHILQMLLIHDLPEAVTGDIPRPVKKQDPQYYGQLEQQAARDSLLSGTCLLLHRALWQEWCEQRSYNAQVAKDLDDLQAVYTFCCLKNKTPDLFTREDTQAWLRNIQQLRTPTVRNIARVLLCENPRFAELLALYYYD